MNFIALQNSYDDVQIALFRAPSTGNIDLIDRRSVTKIHASKLLIPLIDSFFKEHALTLSDIPFLAVNQGPGPFTTLRVVITTANGISYASGIPLVGVNALEAMAQAWQDKTGTLAIILNGFAGDLYYMILENGVKETMGCMKSEALFAQLALRNKPVTFIGNGIALYQDAILKIFGDRAIIPTDYPSYSSIESIAALAYQSWLTHKSGAQQLLPIYLKNHPVQEK